MVYLRAVLSFAHAAAAVKILYVRGTVVLLYII